MREEIGLKLEKSGHNRYITTHIFQMREERSFQYYFHLVVSRHCNYNC
jgi:hypothetical protein